LNPLSDQRTHAFISDPAVQFIRKSEGELIMNEAEFTNELVKLLKAELTDLQVEARKSIFYSLYIDEQGNIPLNLNKQGEPI
jgi:hypothetical protein